MKASAGKGIQNSKPKSINIALVRARIQNFFGRVEKTIVIRNGKRNLFTTRLLPAWTPYFNCICSHDHQVTYSWNIIIYHITCTKR